MDKYRGVALRMRADPKGYMRPSQRRIPDRQIQGMLVALEREEG